jgi:hypothetical protein
MHKTIFSEVYINHAFYFGGVRYVKITPTVMGAGGFKNAEDDDGRGFWFENNDIVEVD